MKNTPKKSNKPKINAGEDSDAVISPSRKSLATPPPEEETFELPSIVAVLPVRNTVNFPGTIVPLAIHREKSRKLLAEVMPGQKLIVTVCQKDPQVDDPGPDDLYEIGTAMMILKLLRMEEGHQNLIVQGLVRVRVVEWLGAEPYLRARIEQLSEVAVLNRQTEALVLDIRTMASRVIELSPGIPDEARIVLNNIDQPGAMADFLAANLPVDLKTKQKLLEQTDVTARLRGISKELQKQIEILELSDKIHNQVRENIDKSQREYFLHEQLKAIQQELGQMDDRTVEIAELREKIVAAKMPKNVDKETRRELGRLEKIPTASPEYNVIRTYLDIMTELPWSVATGDRLDVKKAAAVLDADHYDLEKVKRRVLEYLAVRKLAPESRGPILCFVGPPGVGKTSLGQSIARALGRKFIRMSLGGIRDEAELRGHRRTYIGAMPGRIIQELRKAGSNNPVFMLDELDKVGADFRGDPTSALLEILDPAQNGTFQDHYLNVPFDLSKVLFIATANYMEPVPPALRDRMEQIELPGYTPQEKLHIAEKYLLPRQLRENGLKPSQAKWNDKALMRIIEQYTREVGVRELERQIGSVSRGIAAMVAAGKSRGRTVTTRLITELLGPRKYENELAMRTDMPGVVTGLACTPVGGTILFIEATTFPGRGRMIMTGQIGEVMKESAQAALSLVKGIAANDGMDMRQLAGQDIHIHVPAGAIPKDGPSAGVAMFTALMSLLMNRPARADVAMSGEITLRGLVLPVGGMKDKILAAKRAGIKTVVLPAQNKKDLADLPESTREDMQFIFAKTVDDVLHASLKF